jgi:hypothetical protein
LTIACCGLGLSSAHAGDGGLLASEFIQIHHTLVGAFIRISLLLQHVYFLGILPGNIFFCDIYGTAHADQLPSAKVTFALLTNGLDKTLRRSNGEKRASRSTTSELNSSGNDSIDVDATA